MLDSQDNNVAGVPEDIHGVVVRTSGDKFAVDFNYGVADKQLSCAVGGVVFVDTRYQDRKFVFSAALQLFVSKHEVRSTSSDLPWCWGQGRPPSVSLSAPSAPSIRAEADWAGCWASRLSVISPPAPARGAAAWWPPSWGVAERAQACFCRHLSSPFRCEPARKHPGMTRSLSVTEKDGEAHVSQHVAINQLTFKFWSIFSSIVGVAILGSFIFILSERTKSRNRCKWKRLGTRQEISWCKTFVAFVIQSTVYNFQACLPLHNNFLQRRHSRFEMAMMTKVLFLIEEVKGFHSRNNALPISNELRSFPPTLHMFPCFHATLVLEVNNAVCELCM